MVQHPSPPHSAHCGGSTCCAVQGRTLETAAAGVQQFGGHAGVQQASGHIKGVQKKAELRVAEARDAASGG